MVLNCQPGAEGLRRAPLGRRNPGPRPGGHSRHGFAASPASNLPMRPRASSKPGRSCLTPAQPCAFARLAQARDAPAVPETCSAHPKTLRKTARFNGGLKHRTAVARPACPAVGNSGGPPPRPGRPAVPYLSGLTRNRTMAEMTFGQDYTSDTRLANSARRARARFVVGMPASWTAARGFRPAATTIPARP